MMLAGVSKERGFALNAGERNGEPMLDAMQCEARVYVCHIILLFLRMGSKEDMNYT